MRHCVWKPFLIAWRTQRFGQHAATLLLICLTQGAFGETGDDWSKRVWQMEDGLPGANVTGIVQTPDGYLWVATQSGLARFDGTQFETVTIPVGKTQPTIRGILRDHAGRFWVAEGGGAIARFGKGKGRVFGTSEGLPDALVLRMIETTNHEVWVSYADDSVFRITPEDRIVRLSAVDGLNDDGTCSLTLDASGKLWFAKGLQYGFWNGTRFQPVGTVEERYPQILGAGKGGLWICTSTRVLRIESNAPPVTVAKFESDPDHRIRPSVLFEDFNGRVWIGTASDGLFQLDHTNLFKVETSQNKIHAIFRDREGSIWVGTDGGGLNRLFPKAVELRGRQEGLPFETVRSMSEDGKGDLWVVTQDGALTRLPAGDWASGQPVANWPGGLAHTVVADHQGAMWVGTYRRGLFRWQNGTFTKFTMQSGLAGTAIRSLMVDSRNDLWIGLENEQTVQRFHDGQFQSFKQPANTRAVRAITEDASGKMWFGTLDGRLLRLDDDKLMEVPQPGPDPPNPIRCLSATPDGSVWIGYAVYGLCRWKDGKFSHIDQENGLFDGNICSMMPDAAGRMWFASDHGIFYVNLAQLNKFASGAESSVRSIFYGRDAGLPGLQAYYGYWPGALSTKSGDILFPTHSGIAIIHPGHVRANGLPPNALIQAFSVDEKPLPIISGRSVKLPANHRKIEITFTAPTFTAPEQVHFRYRLTGWNEEWSEVEQRGLGAVFSRLPAGDYTFQVAACNSSGDWSDHLASLTFTVTPFFWQTWSFRILASAVLLVLIVLAVRHFMLRRMQLLLQSVEREATLQKERTRIAQDMHDELGARFTQISLLGELSRSALKEPDKARDFLGQISHVSQAGVKSLDEIVWAVNPRHDTLADLLDYTGQYARDFLAAAGIECRLDFPDPLPEGTVSGEIRHCIFLIIKETLNNVVKHAQATGVRMSFEKTSSGTRWLIEDNGKGFAVAPGSSLADGLRNIQQRAAALGGRAEILSSPETGTRVIVEIPLPAKL
jgi:ligand-binding sensor domain-containing protein/signal transduction histidine kinase